MQTVLAAAAAPQASVVQALLPFVVMLVVFYFLLIRPQQRQQKERQEFLAGLRKGDKIVTVGGIYGEIVHIKDDILTLRIADRVEIRLARAGVARRVNEKEKE